MPTLRASLGMLALAALVGLPACGGNGDGSVATPKFSATPELAFGDVQVTVEERPPLIAGQRRFAVVVSSNGVNVGAYQGLVTFPPGSMNVIGVETPLELRETYHTLNTNDLSSGRIRFAAYHTDAFPNRDDAFYIIAKGSSPLASGQISASLELAADARGVRISQARLRR